jgi:hypothetical protein
MAKTVLNLKLHYQGKILDIAKFGRDFTNKLYIGTNKYLFWQILDSKFPSQHLFLKRKDEKFYLDLLPGMDVVFKQNEQEFDKAALKAKNLINGNEVTLSNEMTGTIQLAPGWMVSFEFMEPWVRVLTEEEKQIVSQYARKPELLPFDRFTRNFLIAATVVTIIGISVFEIMKPKDVAQDTLAQRWEQMQAMATKVAPASDVSDPVAETAGETTAPVAVPVAASTKGVSEGTATSTGMSKAAAKSALSGLLGDSGFSPGGTGTAMNFAVTTEDNIVAASLGGGKGGGGGGKGPGKGSAGGTGGGAGFGSVFDPTEVSGGTSNLAGLSSGRPKGQLSTKAPGGDVTTYVGDVGRLSPVGKPATKVSSGVMSRFSGPGVKKVAEGGIASAPTETRPELQRVEQRITRYKPQIKDLFNRYSQVKSMYGSLRFTVYIDAGGTVADAQITPLSGEFYPEFLVQLRQLILGWRFDNKSLVPYEFMMTFQK